MSHVAKLEAQFPLRIIYDDGQMEIVDSPDDLVRRIDTIDTTIDRGHVWVRDDTGRTVNVRVVNGEVQHFEVVDG
ncbi:MAG: hypothetical protein HYU52_01845 [Acidobacteria bacterium]|nr:hypothetical protein [Acidobacteriota bacterium]